MLFCNLVSFSFSNCTWSSNIFLFHKNINSNPLSPSSEKLEMSIYQVNTKNDIFAFHLFLNGLTFLAALLLAGFQVQQLKSQLTHFFYWTIMIVTCTKMKGKNLNFKNRYHTGKTLAVYIMVYLFHFCNLAAFQLFNVLSFQTMQ